MGSYKVIPSRNYYGAYIKPLNPRHSGFVRRISWDPEKGRFLGVKVGPKPKTFKPYTQRLSTLNPEP